MSEFIRHSTTLREVAQRAGVSMATASRALAGGSASQKTREKVHAAAAELGFVPNATARRLSTGRTDTVAVVMAEKPQFIFRDQFLSMLVSQLAVSLNSLGLLGVLVLADPENPDNSKSFLHRTGADGVIMASYHSSKILDDALRSLNIPVVFVGRPPEELSYFPYVDVDNYRGGYDAAMRLINIGRRNIAQISGPTEMTSSRDRSDGFNAACASRGIVPLCSLSGKFEVDHGQEAMRALMEAHPEVDAVFAQSDSIAAGAMQTLSEYGKKIPGDVAIVGFDDFESATAVNPKLTTMAQPINKVAQAAAKMMKDYLDTGEYELSKQLFRVPLVVRDSA